MPEGLGVPTAFEAEAARMSCLQEQDCGHAEVAFWSPPLAWAAVAERRRMAAINDIRIVMANSKGLM